METSVTIGSLLSTSLTIFAKRLPQLAMVTILIYLPFIVLLIWLQRNIGEDGAILIPLLTLPLIMLCGYIAQSAITLATYHDLRGQGFRLGASVSLTLRRILPLIGLAITASLMISLGTVLLIVPGIMLSCALYVAIPAMMVENLGIGAAISRSFELTAGYRLKIFGLAILVGIVVNIPTQIIDKVLELTMGEQVAAYLAISTLLSGIAGCAASVAAVVTYYRLREDVDGVGLEDLEEVFA